VKRNPPGNKGMGWALARDDSRARSDSVHALKPVPVPLPLPAIRDPIRWCPMPAGSRVSAG
jgi:hypothetical protein